jgi:hypothetical protein
MLSIQIREFEDFPGLWALTGNPAYLVGVSDKVNGPQEMERARDGSSFGKFPKQPTPKGRFHRGKPRLGHQF